MTETPGIARPSTVGTLTGAWLRDPSQPRTWRVRHVDHTRPMTRTQRDLVVSATPAELALAAEELRARLDGILGLLAIKVAEGRARVVLDPAGDELRVLVARHGVVAAELIELADAPGEGEHGTLSPRDEQRWRRLDSELLRLGAQLAEAVRTTLIEGQNGYGFHD